MLEEVFIKILVAVGADLNKLCYEECRITIFIFPHTVLISAEQLHDGFEKVGANVADCGFWQATLSIARLGWVTRFHLLLRLVQPYAPVNVSFKFISYRAWQLLAKSLLLFLSELSRLRCAIVADQTCILPIHEMELPVCICQINEQWWGVVFVFDYSDRGRLVLLNDAVEERHGRTNSSHLIIVIVWLTIIARIRSAISIPKWIDQRVKGKPDRNQSPLVFGHENDLFFAEYVGENRDDSVRGHCLEQYIEETVTHVG